MYRLTTILSALLCLSAAAAYSQAIIKVISPAQGPIAGGTTVTLAGSGFTGATLLLDYNPITPSSQSDTQIVFQTPPHDNGISLVELTGNGPNAYAEFNFMPPSLAGLPPGYITTVMGIGFFTGDGRLATRAMVAPGQGMALGADGSIYFSEPNNQVIRRIRPDGVIERYAGNGQSDFPASGPALQVPLQHPRGLAIDKAGNLYIAESLQCNCIDKIDARTGMLSVIAGGINSGFSGDGGPASKALLNDPLQLAIDGSGNLYVLDWGNVRIRKIDTAGNISTIAGKGVVGYSGDGGSALNATFNVGLDDDGGLLADSFGNLFLADSANDAVRKINTHTGIISTFFGPAPTDAGGIVGIAVDAAGNLYLGMNNIDSSSPRILKLSPSGALLKSWGKGFGFSPDGASASTAAFQEIGGMLIDNSGDPIFADGGIVNVGRIRRINLGSNTIQTVAGITPAIIGDPGPPLATVLNDPGADLLSMPDGDMLTAEGSNYRVRKLDVQGNLTDFAGDGFLSIGPAGGSPLQAAMYPIGLTMKPNGDVIIDNNNSLLAISNGAINPLTGCCFGFSGDGGPAADALVAQPWDIASDLKGDLFIADSNNNRIRKIDAGTGIISTVAGSGPTNPQEGYGEGNTCGDGGPAINACINTPYGIAVAPDGTMYIGENGQRVRKVDPNGVITTFFTNGGNRIRLNSAGNLFMTPYRIEPNGHAFRFGQTSPGNGLGDGGPASQANFGGSLQDPGIAIDSEGNLFFSDGANRRIRAIRFGAVISEPGSTVTATAGTPQTGIVGTSLPLALQVTLKSPAGTLENGIRVDFSSPTSGPSCLFPNGSTNYSVLTDINGHATATCTANMQLGAYSVIATPLALGLSASFALTNAENTNATILPSANPVKAGSPVTLTANVSGVQLAGAAPGSVSFYDGATLLGSSTLSAGSAGVNASFSTPGVHNITVQYAGDATHLPSSSAALSEAVESTASNPSATALSVNGSPNNPPNPIFVYFGSPNGRRGATFSVSVTGSSNGDQVVLLDGNVLLGPPLSLTSGVAGYTTDLSIGRHQIITVYFGNTTTVGSAAPVVTIERSPRPHPR
jgi:streptogramin lyase